MQPLTRDSTTLLLRAIQLAFVGFDVVFELQEIRSRAWASATFSGARHELAFRLEGREAEAAADRFAATLEAAEFRLRGHIVADIALVSREKRPGEVRMRLEALTVEAE
jgi:hypothetical protein